MVRYVEWVLVPEGNRTGTVLLETAFAASPAYTFARRATTPSRRHGLKNFSTTYSSSGGATVAVLLVAVHMGRGRGQRPAPGAAGQRSGDHAARSWRDRHRRLRRS